MKTLYKIKKGLDLRLQGEAELKLVKAGLSEEYALMPTDFQGIVPRAVVKEGDRVLAGVSGGADSVCLLFTLLEYRKKVSFDIKAVHVEHGIRGEESIAVIEWQRVGGLDRILSYHNRIHGGLDRIHCDPCLII